jgi:hypothetical protein
MKLWTIASVRSGYGIGEADAFAYVRRSQVGQGPLARGKGNVPGRVVSYLAKNKAKF